MFVGRSHDFREDFHGCHILTLSQPNRRLPAVLVREQMRSLMRQVYNTRHYEGVQFCTLTGTRRSSATWLCLRSAPTLLPEDTRDPALSCEM